MADKWANEIAPDLEVFHALAETTRDQLPAMFLNAAKTVLLRIEDTPNEQLLIEMGAPDAYAITGLYDGIPLTEKSVSDQPARPDTIWLFRLPILDEWASRGNVSLGDLVGHVYIHELAHHFGWTDDDIAAVDPWWQPAEP